MAANQTKGRRVQPAEYPVQVVQRPRCPKCHSVDVLRYCTRGDIRYCKCLSCPDGTTFKILLQ